jgi:hypothetical protein
MKPKMRTPHEETKHEHQKTAQQSAQGPSSTQLFAHGMACRPGLGFFSFLVSLIFPKKTQLPHQ